MKILGEAISYTIREVDPILRKISDENASIKPVKGGWSKKEILGHLIDSASNNHQRFVRAALNEAQNFPPYSQDKWVDVQKYNEREWEELINLFVTMNSNISSVLEVIPGEAVNNLCNIGKENMVSLEFLANDYLRHLKHHLDVIVKA
jgi:hypothetical protein